MKGKIFSFILGSVVGGALSWAITKKICDDRKEEELESCRESMGKLIRENKELKEKLKEDDAQNDHEDPADIKKRNDELVETVLEGVKAIQKEHKYVNYSDVKDGSESEGGSPVVKDEVKKRIDIERIDERTFNEPNSKFEKAGMTLYMDAVFTDDNDKEMDDGYLSETIGVDIKDELIASEEVGTVYVRNHKTNTDYEIICLDETWSDVHDVE